MTARARVYQTQTRSKLLAERDALQGQVARERITNTELVIERDCLKSHRDELVVALAEVTRCLAWHGEQGHFVAMDQAAVMRANELLARSRL